MLKNVIPREGVESQEASGAIFPVDRKLVIPREGVESGTFARGRAP